MKYLFIFQQNFNYFFKNTKIKGEITKLQNSKNEVKNECAKIQEEIKKFSK